MPVTKISRCTLHDREFLHSGIGHEIFQRFGVRRVESISINVFVIEDDDSISCQWNFYYRQLYLCFDIVKIVIHMNLHYRSLALRMNAE